MFIYIYVILYIDKLHVTVIIVAPQVKVMDESGRVISERYYKAGSSLELTCSALQIGGGVENISIAWKHGERTLSKGIR